MFPSVAHRFGYPESSLPSMVLLLPSAVECESMTLWCCSRTGCQTVEWSTDLDQGIDRCRRRQPRLLTLDPTVSSQAVSRGIALLREGVVAHLLLLDSRPHEVQLAAILAEPSTSYFTRAASPQLLAMAISGILIHGKRAFDPALEPRIRRTPRGFRLDQAAEPQAISLLSKREQQVMRLLAEGRSVRQCAELLELSESTIDNHKSRIMKKLGIHKSSELTLRAIRDGLLVI